MNCAHDTKRASAEAGDTVALGKLDTIKTGDTLSSGKTAPTALASVEPSPPVLAMALSAADRKDDVKLGQALLRLNEEDPSLTMVQNPRTHDIVLWGQGEMHLRVALERLRDRFGVNVKSHPPAIGYQETIRKPITQRGRHKKQSGGHGQFGDVVLEIKPMPRGGGFEFHEKVVGGAVPRNYIRAVEEGVVDGLMRGPLGFPVIDVQVTLTDGSYHSVDSSDLAFRTAARIGVSEALPQCQPVLLEPIHVVEIVCPTEATAKINAILSGRRGQILGFDTREGWPGWDRVRAMMPEAEIGELIVELRSATAGAGSFTRAVRPHGGGHRPRRRPDHRRAPRRGVASSVTTGFSNAPPRWGRRILLVRAQLLPVRRPRGLSPWSGIAAATLAWSGIGAFLTRSGRR